MARRSSGTKGYTGYRGRRRGRGVLAVVLVVILLLACGFLFAQRYMVYDADGSVRFEFPWIKKTPQDDTANGGDSGDDKKQDDLEITVQKPVIKDTYAVELGADALGSDWQAALDGLDKDVNAVAVELKDASGKIHYGSKVQGAIDCGAVAGNSTSDTAIQGLVDSDYYTIGRISTLHDSLYAYEHMTDAAVCQLTGFVWYDTNSTHWLAPEKQAARQYVTDIVTECAQMGFDELLLDDFHYPREGRMSRIKTDERTMTQQEALALLADDIHTALEQAGYKGKLSVSVDADIALAGSEEKSGIVMSELTEKFDRVYVKVTADQLESVTEAMKAYDVEFVPIVTRMAAHDAHGDALGLGDDLLFVEGGILAHVGIEVGFVKRERLLVIARRAARALDDHADLLRVAAHLALAGEKALHKAGLEIGVEHDFKALQVELLHRDLAAAVHGLADQVAAAAGLDKGFGVGHFLLGD